MLLKIVKDSADEDGTIELAKEEVFGGLAKSSFYKRKNPGFPGLIKLENLATEEPAYP